MTVGLLMGIYNEAGRIVECLDYHLPYVDEAVIVIQESDDGTEEIVDEYVKTHPEKPIKVLHFPKMGCSEATLQDGADVLTSDWILYVDADEKFPEEFLKQMHTFVETTSFDGVWFERDNYFDVQVYNDAQPGMHPQVMRIQHPQGDRQFRLTRKSLSVFPRQIHVRARVRREDGQEYTTSTPLAISHIKTIQEQWDANREYLPAVKVVDAFEKTKKGELIEFPHADNLVFAEVEKHIPFEMKRVFYIFGKKGEKRGSHANRKVNEVLICIQGSAKITLNNTIREYEFTLNKTDEGLFIRYMTWVDFEILEDNTILLCLASEQYEAKDYIKDLEQFSKESERGRRI